MVSNRVKRNISGALCVVGVLCVVARGWYLVNDPASGNAWFEVVACAFMTYVSFDNFLIYHRRVKKGIKYGSK